MEQWNSLEIDNKIKRVIKELGLYEEKKYYYLNDFFRVRLIEEISRLNGISLQKYRGKKIITIAEELINEYKYSSFSDYSNGERKKLYRIIKLIFGNENIDKFFIKDENYKNRNIYKVTKELTIFYNFMLEIATISYIRIIRNASEIENNNDVNEERVAEITHRASEIIRMIHPEEDTSFLRECNENVIF